MSKVIKVETENAPKASGPYSQAVIAGQFIFCSGQIAIDPAHGEIIKGGIEEQTRRVMENLKSVVTAAGSALDQVLTCQVFLKSMDDFAHMNEIYREYFSSHPLPARTTVEVTRLPKDSLIEISCIAYRE